MIIYITFVDQIHINHAESRKLMIMNMMTYENRAVSIELRSHKTTLVFKFDNDYVDIRSKRSQ